jgi:DNA-binding CsgD family transcriptional regulator
LKGFGMAQHVLALAIEAAELIARGNRAADQLLVDGLTEYFAADAGVAMTRWSADPGGSCLPTVTAGGAPPPTAEWLELAAAAAPRSPSVRALGRAGVREPVRVSDIVNLRGFWMTEEYEILHGLHGGRYPVGAALLIRPDELVFVGLHRQRRDFTDHELADLRVFQEVLAPALAFRRSLDDAVRRLTSPHPRKASPALPWLTALTGEYVPTPREAEVLALVAQGWTNQQVANRLGITERTIRKHLSAVYEQAGLAGRAAAAAWWRGRTGE